MRGEEKKKEGNPLAKKFEDMSEEEKKQAYENWLEGRKARRGKSKVRRAATQQLIKNHQPEFDSLVAKLGGAKAAPRP